MNGILSVAVFATFAVLLFVAAASTLARVVRYHRAGLEQPVLLGRDRDLVIGLAIPFVVILAVRAFGLQDIVSDESGPHLWYLALTGLPPIYALARYDYFELFRIDRVENRKQGETAIEHEDRMVGDTRRELQAERAEDEESS